MTVRVKQVGLSKPVTGLRVKQGGIIKTVSQGWVKQNGVVKQFFSTAAGSSPINPDDWPTRYYWPGPWTVSRWFTILGYGEGPFTWVLTEYSATGGAAMSIAFGQGTDTVQVVATCPGGPDWGGGELTGELTVNGFSAFINLGFGQIP